MATATRSELEAIDALLASAAQPKVENAVIMKKITDFLSEIPYKILFFIFLVVILITSDIFAEQILRKIPSTTKTSTTSPTIRGNIIQGFAAAIVMLTIIFLDRIGVL